MTFQIHTAYAQTGLHEQTQSSQGILDVLVSLPPDKLNYNCLGTSLVVQWIRIHLPLQGTRVPPLGQKSPHAAEVGPCSAVHPPRACQEKSMHGS